MTETIDTPSKVVSTGKGGEQQIMVSLGKGHRKLAGADNAEMLPLLAVGHLAGKAMVVKAAGAVMGAKAIAGAAVMHSGKGAVNMPQEDVQCQDVSVKHGQGMSAVSPV